MKLSKEQIEKLADLVRLELTDGEKDKFSGEIASILDYVNKLNEVDTEGIVVSADDLSNVLAEDIAEPCEISQKELLKNAPMTEDGFIKVKSVLE